MHILCTICSDLVNQAENIYATNCGHIFHYNCLAQWISRSKSCPQCRHKVTEKCMFRIYPTVSNEHTGDDAATLQSRLDDAQLQLRQHQASSKEKDDRLTAITTELKKNEEVLKNLEKKLVTRESAISALKEQLDYVKIQNRETQRLKEENESLKKNMQTLNGLQKVLNATSDEVDQMLQGYTDVRTIATFATALKRALCESESKKNETRDRLQAAKQQIGVEKSVVADLQAKVVQLEEKLSTTERKYDALKSKRKASDVIEDSLDSSRELKLPRLSLTKSIDGSPSMVIKRDDLNNAVIMQDTDDSFNTMVNRIEKSDSPYLSLKQSSLALSALQRRPPAALNANLKPSELALINAARNATKKGAENFPSNSQTSIFHKKEPAKIDFSDDKDLNISQFNISYDGLGGHSRLDTFPVPATRPPVKSCVPKLSSRHKLKRPNPPAGSQDIGKLLEKIRDK